VVFTNERKHQGRFPHTRYVEYLPMAYNPAVHTPGEAEADLASDVLFIGTGFPERKDLLNAVDWAGIDFKLMGGFWDTEGAIEGRATLNPTGVVQNAESVRYYRSALVNLNLHRTTTIYGDTAHIAPGEAESLGPRAYELAACGAFQLIDDSRSELVDVFGDALPTFRAWDSGDLGRQVRHYLKRPDARARHVRAALEAVRPHTWHARAGQMLNTLLNWTFTEDT
jgi:spore maturation protein CgeB